MPKLFKIHGIGSREITPTRREPEHVIIVSVAKFGHELRELFKGCEWAVTSRPPCIIDLLSLNLLAL